MGNWSLRQFLQESVLGDPSHGLRALFPGPIDRVGRPEISLRSLVVRLILQTNFVNPDGLFLPDDQTRSSDVCNNQTFLDNVFPPWQWTSAFIPTEEGSNRVDSFGISGWAILPQLSGFEVPFTHPFGLDWEFYIAPDRMYINLLAPNNLLTGSNLDREYSVAMQGAIHDLNGLNIHVPGVLGVETDQGLVPPTYRAQHNDRVVVFGRWIADCGHSDFHTEIHPPLLLAVARPFGDTGTGVGTGTVVTVISRPFLVSQEFTPDGLPLREHLTEEINKITSIGASNQVECHVKIFPTPFAGTHSMNFFVRPPISRQSDTDKLYLSCHFTVRSGVTLEITTTPYPDEVQVLITMNEADYHPAPLPPKHSKSIQIADLKNKVALEKAAELGAAELGLNPIGLGWIPVIAEARGIAYDLYDAPVPQSVHDYENVVTKVVVDQNMGTITPFSVGDDQPFPIYGFINLQWG